MGGNRKGEGSGGGHHRTYSNDSSAGGLSLRRMDSRDRDSRDDKDGHGSQGGGNFSKSTPSGGRDRGNFGKGRGSGGLHTRMLSPGNNNKEGGQGPGMKVLSIDDPSNTDRKGRPPS